MPKATEAFTMESLEAISQPEVSLNNDVMLDIEAKANENNNKENVELVGIESKQKSDIKDPETVPKSADTIKTVDEMFEESNREQNEETKAADAKTPTERSLEILKEQLTNLDSKIRESNSKNETRTESVDAPTKPLAESALYQMLTEKPISLESLILNCLDNEDSETTQVSEAGSDHDDDVDLALLCPEVSMDVDDSPEDAIAPSQGADKAKDLDSSIQETLAEFDSLFQLTDEDLKLAKEFGDRAPIQFTRLHCTACNVHLGSALEYQSDRMVHPLLKVLICKRCYHFYTSGEFEKDEDGSELYCRWCGQGGNVICCSKCEFVFCLKCIRTNLGRRMPLKIKEIDDWLCFRCNTEQIRNLRLSCYVFFSYIQTQFKDTSDDDERKWSTDFSTCCLNKRTSSSGNQGTNVKKHKKKDPDFDPLAEDEGDPKPIPIAKKLTQVRPPPLTALNPTPPMILPNNGPPPLTHILLPNGAFLPTYQAIAPIHNVGVPSTSAPSRFVAFQQPPSFQQPLTFPQLMPTHSTHSVYSNNCARYVNSNSPVPKSTALPAKTSFNLQNEWFNKTVRATNSINALLSMSMNQLGQARMKASSLEDVALCHNKLQEALSSSINSLIQVRKNLKSEFLTNLNVVRYNPKAKPAAAPWKAADDDVVLVDTPDRISMARAVVPSTSGFGAKPKVMAKMSEMVLNPVSQKGFLKVRSLADLNSGPVECITIPDEDCVASANPKLSMNAMKFALNKSMAHKNGSVKKGVKNGKIGRPAKTVQKKIALVELNDNDKFTYNVSSEPTREVKKMMNVTVRLPRMDKEFQKKAPV